MGESKSLVIIPRSVDECMSLASELSKATTIPQELRDKPANVLAAIMAGAELGFAPMAALRSVFIIKGIPKLSADAMVAAVLASGKAEYFEPSNYTNTSVTFVTKRVGSQREQSCTWSVEDAKRAGLTSDNHRLYPRQMLAARAKSELARMVYSDVLAGVYTEDEIPSDRQESAPYQYTPSAPIEDAEIVSESPPPPILAELESATTRDAVKALADRLKELPEQWKQQGRDRYKARLAELAA